MQFPGSIRLNLVLVVLLGVLPMLGVIFSSGSERRTNEIVHAQKTTLRLAEYYAFSEKQELARIQKVLANLAQTRAVQAVDEEACSIIFRDYLEANPNYANFALMDTRGFAVSSALPFTKPKDLSNRKEIIDALRTGGFSIGEYTIGRVSKLQILPVAYPVYGKNGKMCCILIASLKLQEYATLFQQAKLPLGSFVSLVDHEGRRLYRYPSPSGGIGKPIPGSVWERLQSIERAGMFTAVGDGNEEMVFAASRLSEKDDQPYLNIVVSIPEQVIIAKADAVTTVYVKWGGAAFVVSVLLAWLIGHFSIHVRVAKLVSVARRLGAGDLKARSGLEAYGGEIGTLASAVDSMAEALEYDALEREKARQEAEKANAAKTEFLANMSHEIRTPLNGIMGMLHLLNTASLASEQKAYVDYALQSSGRLTRLLSDILDLSKVEAGRMEFTMEPFDFKDVMDAIVQLFEPSAREKGLELRMAVNPEIPSMLLGDAVRLQQVLSNLVGNAVKFTNQGSVTVDAHPLPPKVPGEYRVLFSIADTGIGIDGDMLDKLFTPFSQLEESYTRHFQGAGLGLAICKRLVHLMGGEMAVESERGQGSCFYFCIPFKRIHGPVCNRAAKPVSPPAPLPHLHVLVAEDDAVSSLLIVRLLDKQGHQAEAVVNGKQALASLREKRFDLVLMDVQMPVLDGVQATKAIRKGQAGAGNKDIPIVAMTAYSMAGDSEKFIAAGMDGYVAKPVDVRTLSGVLHNVLGEKTGDPVRSDA